MDALIFLLFILGYFFYFGLLSIPFFKPAGRKTWEALLPIYNIYVMTRIIDRPWWWVILAALPVVGNVMMIVIMYEMLHVYRLGTFKNILIVTLTAGLYYAYLGFGNDLTHHGRDIKEIRKHISELAASIIFAIVAATTIRAYTFEAFTIPTPSMEKSLLVGDFLFVSKFHYGVRVPMTPFSLPLVHNHIPGSATINSYMDAITLPYLRLPAFTDIERNDPIVFNYPAEDIRGTPFGMEGETRPIDKREHYVKRVVGLPGDELVIKDAEVFINGETNQLPPRFDRQLSYQVFTDPVGLSENMLKDKFNINFEQAVKFEKMVNQQGNQVQFYLMDIPDSQIEAFRKLPAVQSAQVYLHQPNIENPVFPNPYHIDSLRYKWSRDNYGPLWIPKEGETIELNLDNFYRYKRVIEKYEDNQSFEYRDGQFLLNQQAISEYTFKQDYYFMIGDNRHSSDDSRFWGFVPHDHIVGKPVFIWMSYDKYGKGMNKIRTDRVFTTVSGSGERQSYFWPFMIVVALIYGINAYRKKRQDKKKA